MAAERAHADWEYFTIAPYIQPHFVPDGSGVYELIATVSFRTAVPYQTLDHVPSSLTQGTYRRCLTRAWRGSTRMRLVIYSCPTQHWKGIGSTTGGLMTR